MAPKSKKKLQAVDALRERERRDREKRDAEPAPKLPDGCRQVVKMDDDTLMNRIEEVEVDVVRSILRGDGYRYAVPSRAAGNQLYVPGLDRIVLRGDTVDRRWGTAASVRKTTIMSRVKGIVYEARRRGIHITKRDLFYTDVKLFSKQGDSDAGIEDLAMTLGCTRHSLGVVASEKGTVVGRLQFRDDGDEIDCARIGVSGKSIPASIERITDIRSDARFILLVEKDAAFARLAEDRFYNEYPCIIITAKGQPDVATRELLRRLKLELRIPVLALVDADPYGLKILSVYMSGSKSMSYDSANLVTPNIRWLGVRPSDYARFNLPEQVLLDMSEHDMKTGRKLLEEDFVRQNPDWTRELHLMLKLKKKAEIQALSSHDLQFLTRVYLPQKLAEGDWI